MIGKTISHYRITEKLGEGGMGVVYRADDTTLKRTVALKFLPKRLADSDQDKARFLLEAQAASALNHANISHIYEIDEVGGETFIAMEFIDGGGLRERINAGPMKMHEAIDIAIQLGKGLQQAHTRGIIHRDIKPENIIITRDGIAKILDFGVARMTAQSNDSPSHTLYGSIAYMSPEQVRGEQVSHATDIWSLGVVLYEMVTGRLPFRGEYEQMISYSIGNEQHPPVSTLRSDVPLPLEKVIDRCLDKISSVRFHDMDDLLAELSRIDDAAMRPHPKEKSIAVLPCADISTDDEDKYFSDGLTEQIITNLSKLRKLKVVSLASVLQYERGKKTLRQSAVDLGVQYLLEGSVRKHGTDLRITAKLTDSTQDAYLWAETYRGSLEDVFDIQEKVAGKIVRALKVRLTPDEKRTLKKRYTENTEAYQLYLQGRYFWNKRNEAELKTAIRYFERAIEKDPGYALAWAGIADSYSLLGEYGNISRKDVYPKARAAANTALQIDDQLAEVHTSLASLFMLNAWDWDSSEKEFTRAIALNPNYATAHHWYSQWLMCMGRTEESLRTIARAVELDPISQAIVKDYGLAYYYTHQYDKALELAKRTLDLDPNYAGGYRLLSLAYQGKKMFDEAIAHNERWGTITTNSRETMISLAQLYAISGRGDEARNIIRTFETDNILTDNICRGLALV
ncbi:MAG: protein kinase, partial [Ignavibacteriae bacterium]|nr:protein kinase [Ignavibacteriota bacterium]